MRSPALFACATLAATLICVASAQQDPQNLASSSPPRFKASTRIVTVNVVVTDPHGNAITGLTKDDFDLLDEGKPQDIRFFDAIKNEAPAPAAPQPPGTYTNQQPTKGVPPSVTAILFDTGNTDWVPQAYALHRLRAFLRQLHPEDRVALYVRGETLKLLHDFTQDSSDLIAAIHRYDARHGGAKDEPNPTERSELDSFLSGSDVKLDFSRWKAVTHPPEPPRDATPDGGFGPVMPGGAGTAYRSPHPPLSIITTLSALARHLSSARGRKSLVWIAQRMPIVLPNQQGLQESLLEQVVRVNASGPKNHGFKAAMFGANGLNEGRDRALRDIRNGLYSGDLVPLLVRLFNDNDIAVYPVSAEGLQALDLSFDGVYFADIPPPALISNLNLRLNGPWGASNITAHMEMEDLAQRTGGRAFYNRNDLETGVRHAVDDARYTYELAYYPDHNRWNGDWRKIEVKLKNPERFVAPPHGAAQEVKNFLVGGFSVHVLARAGYFALPEPKPAAHEDRRELITTTINSPEQAPQLPFTVRIVAVADSKTPQVQAVVTIDAHNLLTPEGDGRWLGNFELFFAQLGQNQFAVPSDAKQQCCTLRRPLDVPVRTMQFTLSAGDYKKAIEDGIVTTKTLQLQPGATVLSIVLHDKISDAVGSVRIPLEQYAAHSEAPGSIH